MEVDRFYNCLLMGTPHICGVILLLKPCHMLYHIWKFLGKTLDALWLLHYSKQAREQESGNVEQKMVTLTAWKVHSTLLLVLYC